MGIALELRRDQPHARRFEVRSHVLLESGELNRAAKRGTLFKVALDLAQDVM